MQEFLLNQMDYISFIYGLAFFLLFFVCIFLHKQHKSFIPWNYLGLFGLIHGTNEWLDLLATCFGDNDLFKCLRLIIMAVSYINLFEFGRLTCERFDFIKVGRWIYLPMFLVFFLERSAGFSELIAFIRYSFGFFGGLWAALAFWRISRDKMNKNWDMTLAAAAMAVYAIAAGLIVPKAEVFSAAFINDDSFFLMAGIPVQFLRALAACVITGSIWHYNEEFRALILDHRLARRELKFGASVVVGLILIIAIGWLWVQQVGQNEAYEQRAKLSGYAQQIVEELDLQLIKELNGTREDIKNPNYIILKNELQQIRDTMGPVRNIYLMRHVGRQVLFLVDSENPGSKDESPPGQSYVEASSQLRQVFKAGNKALFDQYTDRWGTWESLFTPLSDERTGQTVAVLGIDESVQNFKFYVQFERLKAIVLIAIISLSLLLIMVYWQRIVLGIEENNAGKYRELLAHWGVAVIVGLIGITLTIFLYLELRSDAWDLFQTTFQQRAMSRVQGVSEEVQRQLDRLSGLCQFMGSNNAVEREEFNQYVEPFLKDVPVHAFAWLPRVKKEDLLFYESSAMQDGLDGYHVYEKNAKGLKIPVRERDEYFPVYYDQPLKGNEEAMGYDEASDPERRVALNKSCDEGLPIVTPPLVLRQSDLEGLGFLVYMPVYSKDLPTYTVLQRRKSLKGFVLGVYSSQEFLKGIYSRMPAEGLACLIEDPSSSIDRRVLYRHKVREGSVDWSHPLLTYITYLKIADRQWKVTIIPGTLFIERNLSRVYWWVLFVGLVLTAVLAALLNFLATSRYHAENLVKLRTAELDREKETLQKREEDFHLILDSTAEAIYGIDLEGNCTFCNPSCVRMLGYNNIQDLLGKNMHSLIHHTHLDGRPFPIEECQLFLAFRNGLKVHVEEVFWRSDGTYFFAEVWSYPEIRSGKTVGAVVSFWDITERKSAEESLRQREAYLTSILDNFPYEVWLKDANGRYLAVNKIFAKAHNLFVGDIIGKSDFDIWPQETAKKYNAIDVKVINDRQKVIIEESNTMGGVEKLIEKYKSPVFDNKGAVIGTVGFARDITEQRKAEESLKLAKDTAEQALAIKDEFTSTVSHELRTPLAAIKSSIDILDTEAPGVLTPDQKIFIKRVKSNIDRLARLINDVLDLSKLESGKMMMNLLPLRVEDIVHEVVEIQEPLVNAKGLKIETEFGENLPMLIADRDRLLQVLNNLISNALKFTREGGIVISVHTEDKQTMFFSVRDTGVGIKDEDLSKLFQKFQQVGGASQQVAGTGLGLAICKLIIAKHNGRIWVESEFGKGSAFNFIMPIRKGKRILIVDDDPLTLEIIRNILDAEDCYEIEMASDGFLAGQKYYDFNPHLIILDVKIPKINGLEVCSRIKSDAKTKSTKIIMLSDFNSEVSKKSAWDAGADEIIIKPINSEELMAKVRKLI